MANPEHLDILEQGIERWNEWRRNEPSVEPDLSNADLTGRDLARIKFYHADLSRAKLAGSDLTGALFGASSLYLCDLRGADLSRATLDNTRLTETNLSEAILTGAHLLSANLFDVNLQGAQLEGAHLTQARVIASDLSRANLRGSYLCATSLVDTNLSNATLSDSHVYGISVWNVKLSSAISHNLVITPPGEPTITTDNLELAQLVYLLLSNEKIRGVIDTVTAKTVLILGRFTPERKVVLDAIRDELRRHDYVPVLFDFDSPSSRDLTETIRILAHLARFIIADITDPRSIPQELQAIVPHLSVPVVPLLQESNESEYGMFGSFRRYPWVLEVHKYRDLDEFVASIEENVISPAERKLTELK